MAIIRAIVEEGVVVNMIVVADDDPTGIDTPEGMGVGIGWLYDGESFTPAPPSPAPVQYKSYTMAQFIEAMTRPEALDFLATMKTDPLLEVWYELAKARNLIDFNDADTLTNAPYLVQAGVFTQARLNEVIGLPS